MRRHHHHLGAGHPKVHRLQPRRHNPLHLALELVRALEVSWAEDTPHDDKDGAADEEELVRHGVDRLPGEVHNLKHKPVRHPRQVPLPYVDPDRPAVFVDFQRPPVNRHHRLHNRRLTALAIADHDQLDRRVDGARDLGVGHAQERHHRRAPLLCDFWRRAREAGVALALELCQRRQPEQRLNRQALQPVAAHVERHQRRQGERQLLAGEALELVVAEV